MASKLSQQLFVNLGCGSRFHPDWMNFDIEPFAPGVLQADLSKGIPLPDAVCDVVYHSAVLEHIRREDAAAFLAECFRVLRPGGLIRVAVPDFERICIQYLQKLDRAAAGDESAARDYEWMLIEAFDQMVRERSGGEMLSYLRRTPLLNEAFVLERIGEEGRELLAMIRGETPAIRRPITLARLAKKTARVAGAARRALAGLFLTRHERRALRVGRFRLGGEVHQWVYDRYSLGRVLREAGFVDPQVNTATSSGISGWAGYSLDALPGGEAIKPDLFYMEATRPVGGGPDRSRHPAI